MPGGAARTAGTLCGACALMVCENELNEGGMRSPNVDVASVFGARWAASTRYAR